MKLIIVVALALAAVAVAAPPDYPKIVKSEFEQAPAGGYKFRFETENGINRNENGELKQVVDEEKKPQTVVVVRGSYSYINPNGVLETINYSADENGFYAEGPSIPKAARR